MALREINLTDTEKFIKIVKNGPYLVYGEIPLINIMISTDKEGYPYE